MPYVQEKDVIQLTPEKEAARAEAIKLLDHAVQTGAMKQQWATKYKNQLLSGQRDAEEWIGRWTHDYKIPEPPAHVVDFRKMPNANFSKTPWAEKRQKAPPDVVPGAEPTVENYKGFNLAGLTKKETTYIQGHIDAGLDPHKVDAYIKRRLATRGLAPGAKPSKAVKEAQADPLHGQQPSARVVPDRPEAQDAVRSRMMAASRSWRRSLTPEEKSALGYYTGSGFGPLNGALRKAQTPATIVPQKSWEDFNAKDVRDFKNSPTLSSKLGMQSQSAVNSVSHGAFAVKDFAKEGTYGSRKTVNAFLTRGTKDPPFDEVKTARSIKTLDSVMKQSVTQEPMKIYGVVGRTGLPPDIAGELRVDGTFRRKDFGRYTTDEGLALRTAQGADAVVFETYVPVGTRALLTDPITGESGQNVVLGRSTKMRVVEVVEPTASSPKIVRMVAEPHDPPDPADLAAPAQLSPGQKNYVRNLDSALGRAENASDEVRVFRGITPSNPLYRGRDPRIGTVVEDAGYMSTSISRGPANSFAKRGGGVIEIIVPRGGPGMYVEQVSSVPHELEYLFPRGTKLRVLGESPRGNLVVEAIRD